MSPTPIALVADRIVQCRKCPELRAYCEKVAHTKRKAYAKFDYWGRPVPSFGDHRATIMIVGLAPGAHGANRTGRIFTGDRSGDFLYAALHRAGLANQAASTDREDGLKLKDVYITAAAHCAPPDNHPTPLQLARCRPYLEEELRLLKPRVAICLGGIAWYALLAALDVCGFEVPRPRPKFAHGTEANIGGMNALACYHVSQQNTFTGRLTPAMLDDVLERACDAARQATDVRMPTRDEPRG